MINDNYAPFPKKRAKRDTMLKDDKKTPLNMIPSFTHSKINDGCGIGYSPLSLSNVTGNHNSQRTEQLLIFGPKIRNLLATSRVQF